jgi:hypothetical protein
MWTESKSLLLQSIPNTSNKVARNINLRAILQISVPVSVLLYCAGFHYSYVNWVSPTWSYEGLTYIAPPLELLFIAYGLAALLAMMSPTRILKPSHAAYWVLFFIVYIPGIFVPLFLGLETEGKLLSLQLCLIAGMIIIALSSRLPSLTFRRYPLRSELFWAIFITIYVIGNATMIIVYRNYMHFASIDTMYSVRHESGKVLVANPVTGYISQLLANVLNPILMVYGLASRKRRLYFVGLVSEIILYCIFANKLALLSPLGVAGFYYTLKRDLGSWVPRMNLFLAGILFTLTTMVIGVGAGVVFNVATVAIVRTFAIPGMLVGQYQYFFESRPHTNLSTVNGINFLVPNPYTLPLGMEVSAYYGNKADPEKGRSNENANLFATDGIAAFGLPGIFLAGVLCAGALWILDGCAKLYPLKFSIPALTMVMYSLTNVSLFTTLLGNGLIALMILFIIMPLSFEQL